MALAGVAHAAYMIAIGGDYMHGRLLLPALVACALPASVGLPITSPGRVRVVAVAVVAVWGVVCAGWLRYENRPALGVATITDWRQRSPVVEPDEGDQLWLTGAEIAALYANGERGTIRLLGTSVEPTGDPERLVWVQGSIGLAGYEAGIEVHVVDIGGLAEPLAARSDPVAGSIAGHRKIIDPAWAEARFGVGTHEAGDPANDDAVAAAARTLECPALRDLFAAIGDPMTPGRFAANLVDSVRLTRLRVPADPFEAERELC